MKPILLLVMTLNVLSVLLLGAFITKASTAPATILVQFDTYTMEIPKAVADRYELYDGQILPDAETAGLIAKAVTEAEKSVCLRGYY